MIPFAHETADREKSALRQDISRVNVVAVFNRHPPLFPFFSNSLFLSLPNFPLATLISPSIKSNTMKSKLAFALATTLLFSSCAQDSLTGDTYSRGEAGRAQAVQTGRITSIRPVKIEGGSQGGALAGAIAGGVLGSNIGSGRASNTAGAIGGAMVGSAIGSQAQQAMTSRRGIEISVRLDQGGSVAIVQEVNPREQFSVGDRVRIISSGGRSRVSY
jgi:outer membrane lipoprotein SlyB